MVKKEGDEMEMLTDFERALEVIPYFSRGLRGPRSKLQLNYIFLFYYSILTLEKRKINSLFSIRANFQTLMFVLNRREKK